MFPIQSFKYVLQGVPPSNNKFIGRNARWAYREQKKEWEQLIKLSCVPCPEAPLERAKVDITYYFPNKRRRDPDNYSGKFILDGLVRAGVLADDSFNNVILNLQGDYCKNHPHTEITINEIEQDDKKD